MHCLVGSVYCSRDLQVLYLEKKKKKKKGSLNTIHVFKNYFTTVFLVFSKISNIQTDPKSEF